MYYVIYWSDYFQTMFVCICGREAAEQEYAAELHR